MDQPTHPQAPDFEVYSFGACFASVCTSLPVSEATDRLNAEYPTGIKSRWELAREDFRTGESNPCPCSRSPATHKHYLFEC